MVNKGGSAVVNSGWFCNHGKQALTEVVDYIFSTLRVGFIVQDVHIEVADNLDNALFVVFAAFNTVDNAAMYFQSL